MSWSLVWQESCYRKIGANSNSFSLTIWLSKKKNKFDDNLFLLYDLISKKEKEFG